MQMNDNPGIETGQNFLENKVHVASDPQHVRRIDKQKIPILQSLEEQQLDVLHLLREECLQPGNVIP